jgi:hypothetical protein
VTNAPADVPTGDFTASGFTFEFGLDSFVAWCFDLQHTISLGASLDYEVTETPFSNSFLAPGAKERMGNLFNAAYDEVDPFDVIDATAFQMSIWEVAYDTGFDLANGAFLATSSVAGAVARAVDFLSAADGFSGPKQWDLLFLESQETPTTQNLVSAAPVPLPASAPLLLGAICGSVAYGRRRKR